MKNDDDFRDLARAISGKADERDDYLFELRYPTGEELERQARLYDEECRRRDHPLEEAFEERTIQISTGVAQCRIRRAWRRWR